MRAFLTFCLAAGILPLFALALPATPAASPLRALNPSAEERGSWAPAPLSRYEGILERMPFGRPPPAPVVPVAATPQTPLPAIANQLVLYAILRTPAGAVAVGFGDNGQKPPRYYYLMVGESQDGYRIVEASYDSETVVIDKDGATVTLRLGNGTRTVQPTSVPANPDGASALASSGRVEVKTAKERPPPMFKSATEQLLSMELSVPAGIASPPLPIAHGVEEDARKALKEVIVIETNDTEQVAAHKETIGWAKEEMRSRIKEGGSAQSYLETLKSRREQEIARQKAAREMAETRIRELAKQLSKQELEKQLEGINKALSESGVDPIEAPAQE